MGNPCTANDCISKHFTRGSQLFQGGFIAGNLRVSSAAEVINTSVIIEDGSRYWARNNISHELSPIHPIQEPNAIPRSIFMERLPCFAAIRYNLIETTTPMKIPLTWLKTKGNTFRLSAPQLYPFEYLHGNSSVTGQYSFNCNKATVYHSI